MRKHSVRKWLHAILDLLPVIILPIFAIYSHRHTIDSYEVTVSQNEVVNFNQFIENGDFESNTNWQTANYLATTLTINDNEGAVVVVNNTYQYNYEYAIYTYFNSDFFEVGHKYIIHANCTSNDFSAFGVDEFGGNQVFNNGYIYWTANNQISQSVLFIRPAVIVSEIQIGWTYEVDNVFAIDLTLMFGLGNEPTLEQFNQWYSEDYYEYNIGTKQLLKNVSTVTYDNTDIGSQMIYSLYKPINDYFNLNNVFNFGAIYDWFELNMFNGNAPLSIFIVWNIIVYEFIMDIIFLIYSVFMFVIDFACETLDRFTGWAKRGD